MVHLRPWGPLSLGAVLLCLRAVTASPAMASAGPTGTAGGNGSSGNVVRVVVWETHAGDAFLSRLRGQTVDLSVQLLNVDAGYAGVLADAPPAVNLSSALDRQVAMAEELAARHGARVITWRAGEDVLVLLATPAHTRLLVRRIGRGTGSAHLEAAALVVRGALVAILEGGTFGVVRAESPVPAPPSPPSEALPSPADAGKWSAFILADFRLASDGVGNSAPKGFGAHLGFGWWRWAAGATGMFTFDRDVGTSIHQPFWKQNAAIFVAFDFLDRGRAHFTGEVQGGVATFNLYRTSGTVHRSVLLLGAEVRASVDALTWGRMAVPLWVAAGADYIRDAPPLRVTTDGPILWTPQKFQPRLMFGTGLSF